MSPLPNEIKDWLWVLQWLVTAALGVSVWLRKPGQAAGEAVSALRRDVSTQMAELQTRNIVMEEKLKHVPSAADLVELEGSVKAAAAQTAGLVEAMGTMRVQLNRIESYLLRAQDTRL